MATPDPQENRQTTENRECDDNPQGNILVTGVNHPHGGFQKPAAGIAEAG
jgi:hypothetical protein